MPMNGKENVVVAACRSGMDVPGGLVVRIRRSHRRGRGSIPRLGTPFVTNYEI